MSDSVDRTGTKTALIGIGGGVAAYKAVTVVSQLRKAGVDVHVAMSKAAQQFVTPLTFAAVSGNPVLSSIFPETDTRDLEATYPHLYPSTRADIFAAVPATADLIAHFAQGLGHNLVAVCALSLPPHCRRFICPAMNVEMWNQEVVQDNVDTLRRRGWTAIGPDSGHLACGMQGAGRMAEPDEIVSVLTGALDDRSRLQGRSVLILSGPTHEHIDPVRFIGNPSSGKMGRMLAEAAVGMGATVQFITGPVAEANLPAGPGITLHPVTSAQDMLDTSGGLFAGADIVIFAAAVADYAPESTADKKLPKHSEGLSLKLKSTPDIAATLNETKRANQVVIGFALQSHDGPRKAREKLRKKKFDGIVLNYVNAMGADTSGFEYLGAEEKDFEDWGRIGKSECARNIIRKAADRLERV
ncbi:MAG: bifunctional phosphopantothenoylcysteine decarboxylase/phosphopantothenate--cysteine ligase CoaBC [Verrucomicrobia bacterium]|nr:bifunctional phosphopantothenoylcysteine decarboxylase/phosphopantothenate--cysteine ligase CoaBC [Verrucomicrobiota bacterium]